MEILGVTGSLLGGNQQPGFPPAKQMSDDWIEPRLEDELGEEMAAKVETSKYERWLMIVGPSGQVEQITKLDSTASAITAIHP